MAFPLFKIKNKQDPSLALLLDIGSASVGAALVKIEQGKEPLILFTLREDIAFQEVLSSVGFLRAMNRALISLLKKTEKAQKGSGGPAHAFITLSSPWFMLRKRTLNIEREKPFIVTSQKIEELLGEDVEHLRTELSSFLPPNDLRIIEKKIIQLKLNGYDVKNPYGQTTARVEIVATVSVSSDKATKMIERAIGQSFGISENIHFGAFPIAAFSAIRDVFLTEQHYLFLDITGEATDVSLIERDALAGTISFARGRNFFIRELSAAFRTPHEAARSLFSMYLDGTLEESKRAKVEAVVRKAEHEWVMRFEKTLGTLAGGSVVPHVVFYTADADMNTFFSRLIISAKPGVMMVEKIEPRFLDQYIIGQFVSFESGVIRDPFLVVEALLAEKVLHAKNV